MDKRAPLRQYFSDEDKAKQEAKRTSDQIAQAKSLEKTLFESFKSVVSVLEGQNTKAETIGLIVNALDDLDKQTGDNKTQVAVIKEGLKELEKQIESIPVNSLKQIPKFLQQREEVKVSNLSDLSDVLERVEGAVKSLELNVEAPKINIPAPQVRVDAPIINVPETDLTPLVKAMREVVDSVKAIEYPVSQPTDLKTLEKEAKEHTTLLKKIVDKPVGGGGGGGGGNGTPYISQATGNASYVSLTPTGSVPVGNARSKFRDGFASTEVSQPDPLVWDLVNDDETSAGHILSQGGDSSGSSYLRISMSPFTQGSEVSLTSLETFTFPLRAGFGISTSQRMIGQEVFFGLVGVDADRNVEYTATPADLLITGATASITSNVATFTITDHGLNGGDRVNIFGCAERRLNVGPVAVTVLTKDTFTVPCTLANGTYSTVGGYTREISPVRDAKNAFGYLLENATTTNATLATRRNGAKYLYNTAQTIGSTAATQTNTNPFTDAFNPTAAQEIYGAMDEMLWRSVPANSQSGISGSGKYSQSIPDNEIEYKLHIRARNLTGFTRPVARVSSISKTASTTATVTTDAAHGLATGDFIQMIGMRDQTNFANLTTATAITVTGATTFTVVFGASATATSAGGTVFLIEGSVNSTALSQSAQSISRTSNVLTVIGNTTWATPLPGEMFHLYGLEAAASAYEGAYKVLRVSTTTLELESVGPNFGSITTGGTLIRRTDVRLHYVRVMDYTRLVTEVVGGRGTTSDGNNAVPVTVTASATITANQGTLQTGSAYNLVTTASTNAGTPKTSAGNLYGVTISNVTATPIFVKFYNKASAPTVGTDIPVLTIPVAANATEQYSFGTIGKRFATGIASAATGAIAATDTSNAVAGVQINATYI